MTLQVENEITSHNNRPACVSIRVTFVVAFGFFPKIMGGGVDLQMMVLLKRESWAVGTLNPTLC